MLPGYGRSQEWVVIRFARCSEIKYKGENLRFEEDRNMYPQRTPPVKEGSVYDVRIESLGREGDGIAKVENFVVIVPNTQVNDNIKVRITKVARRVAFGEVVEGSQEESEEIIEEFEEIQEEE